MKINLKHELIDSIEIENIEQLIDVIGYIKDIEDSSIKDEEQSIYDWLQTFIIPTTRSDFELDNIT